MPRQSSSGAVTGLEMLYGALQWVLWASGLVVLGVTLYYVYGTIFASDQLFRGLSAPGQVMSAQEFGREISNVQLLMRLLLLAGIVGTAATLLRFYEFAEAGVALALLGAALFFGMPIVIDSMGGAVQPLPHALAVLGNPREYLKGEFALVGLILFGAGAADLMVHGVIFVAGARKRRPKANEEAAKTAAQIKKRNNQFLGPCWNLPFCRDTEKKLCPVRANKRPCWRSGRGCYCDQNIILTLSGGSAYAASRGTAGYLSRSATIARPKSFREKRAQCLQCPVYLHHQSQKYNVLAPLSLLIAVGVVALKWPEIHGAYPSLVKAVGRSLSSFSFGPSANGIPGWANDLATNQGVMWMLLLVVGLFVIAYLLHAAEWVLYRLGI